MLWGFFLKIVLADRIAVFVDTVYSDYTAYPGFYILAATMLFAVQIYCDFSGYSIIAMGTAEILGIRLMENFNAPYLSGSVAEAANFLLIRGGSRQAEAVALGTDTDAQTDTSMGPLHISYDESGKYAAALLQNAAPAVKIGQAVHKIKTGV